MFSTPLVMMSHTDVEAMRRAVADCRKLARDTRLAADVKMGILQTN